MTIVEACLHLMGFLREEQRLIPHVSTDYDDPLPHAVGAVNAALQTLAVASPLFATKRPKSAWFHAEETVAITGATSGGKVASCAAWPTWAAGCKIELPGDDDYNRIVSVSGTVATLQFPHLGDATGSATLYGDSAILDSDVITVLDPVETRGGVPLRPASGRGSLKLPSYVERTDFGRISRITPVASAGQSYWVETVQLDGAAQTSLRMMLHTPPSADYIVGFNARCALARFEASEVTAESTEIISVPSGFVETLFLPLAVVRFLSSPAMQNFDVGGTTNARALEAAVEQTKQGFAMLEKMNPQAVKGIRIYPGLG
jgi:hypothetical protein